MTGDRPTREHSHYTRLSGTPDVCARGSSDVNEFLELRDLAAAQCDETISAADFQRLEAMLLADRKAIQTYIEFMDIHAGLDWEATSQIPWLSSELLSGVRSEGGEVNRDSQPDCQSLLGISTPISRSISAIAFSVCVLCFVAILLILAVPSKFRETEHASSKDYLTGNGEQSLVVRTQVHPAATVISQSSDCRWTNKQHPDLATFTGQVLAANETLQLDRGHLQLRFEQGVTMTLDAPATIKVLSPRRARAVRGKLTAQVEKGAEGFTIETSNATVVDLGTVFGLEVDEVGHTDVVVFKGLVDLRYGQGLDRPELWQQRQLTTGEALRVDDAGRISRIVSVLSDHFPKSDDTAEGRVDSDRSPRRGNVIADVQDNIRGQDSWNFYEIVHRGMQEDAKAFVDREEHEWNGIADSGMPPYLVGGDYVKMFQNDKITDEFEIYITLAQPARLYVLFDDRIKSGPVQDFVRKNTLAAGKQLLGTHPKWLQRNFKDTGDNIGIDMGAYPMFNGQINRKHSIDIGTGNSVDNVLSVWVQEVTSPTTVRLGATEAHHDDINMYGIVAIPLEGEP